MILYIHSDEMADTGRTFGRHRHRDVRHLIVPEDTSLSVIADRAEGLITDGDREASSTPIEMVLFNGHGSPGTIYIGETITIHNVDVLGARLRPLIKPLSDGGEGIEVHCCNVASQLRPAAESYSRTCTPRTHTGPSASDLAQTGVRFIYRMACAFNTRVLASLDEQVADSFGFFENSLVEATPSGDADWDTHVRPIYNSPLIRTGNTTALGMGAVFGFY